MARYLYLAGGFMLLWQFVRFLQEAYLYKNIHLLRVSGYFTVFPLIGDKKSSYKATAIDIDENAGLVVKLSDGETRTLHSGEVSLKSGEFVT